MKECSDAQKYANRLVCLLGGFGHGFRPKTERLDLALSTTSNKTTIPPKCPRTCGGIGIILFHKGPFQFAYGVKPDHFIEIRKCYHMLRIVF